MPGEKVDTT